jgi:hypothetical protein
MKCKRENERYEEYGSRCQDQGRAEPAAVDATDDVKKLVQKNTPCGEGNEQVGYCRGKE